MPCHRLRNQFTWAVVAVIAVWASTPAGAQAPAARYSAFAVNLGGDVGATTAMVEINITRWSTDAEINRLMEVLTEVGPDKMLDALRNTPRVGSIAAPGSVGLDIHIAQRTVKPDGATRVVLLTDRPIQFWEQWNRTRSLEYPFMMIELDLTHNGTGSGKLHLAAKLAYDTFTKAIELERFDDQPVMLQNVKPVR